jgi:type IV secretory pathway TrbD component
MPIRTILWIALFSSTFMYLVVAQMATPPPTASPNLVVPLGLAFAALSCAVVSFILPAKLAGDGLRGLDFATESAPSFGDLPGETLLFKDSAAVRLGSARVLFTPFILTMALREAVAVNGLVLAFMGYPLTTYIGFFVVTWVLMLLAFPGPSKDDAAIEKAYGAKLR